MSSEFETVQFIDEVYTYVASEGVYGYLRRELVTGKTTVDNVSDREMIYRRFSFAPSPSGEFKVIEEQPFGFASVSGA
jgi:hypothetical protein